MIYFDNAATTEMDDRVLDVMVPYLKGQYGNPGTLYKLGRDAKLAINKAREQVAELINCSPDQVVFTSGGSEANNFAFNNRLKWSRPVITTKMEHDSVREGIYGLDWMANDKLPVNRKGVVLPEVFSSYVNGFACYSGGHHIRTAAIMYVNNEVGSVNPVSEIARICDEAGIALHVDCVQALGSIPVDVRDIGCASASFSSHKIHGPKGVGALYIENSEYYEPLIFGGDDQEFGLRGGTENVAGIVGFGEACRIVKEGINDSMRHTKALKNVFLDTIRSELNNHNELEIMHINGDLDNCVSKILSLRFDGVDAQTLVLMADTRGVCISAGSACRSHDNEPSPALLAMGLTDEQARSTVRISFSIYNTLDEAREGARIIARCALSLKNSGGGQNG